MSISLSMSNIGWARENDETIYGLLAHNGFTGVEIAPTRVIDQDPYDHLDSIKKWKNDISERYGFVVPSMQSIWYGRKEKIFGSNEEKEFLVEYTKKAIDFAASIDCKNLVFGCPQNRCMPHTNYYNNAISFFEEISDYALQNNTFIGIEANPAIYKTNFITRTAEAFQLIEDVKSKGLRLNLDLGTMIENGEDSTILRGNVSRISHVHISEPYLEKIKARKLHCEIKEILTSEDYEGFISIEVGRTDDISEIQDMMEYVGRIFNE